MEEKIYVFVRFQDNWADEIDVDNFCAKPLTKEEYDYFMKAVEFTKNYRDEMCYTVGSNEWIDYANGEEYMAAYEIKTISKEEYEVLEKLGLTGDQYLLENFYDMYYEHTGEEE